MLQSNNIQFLIIHCSDTSDDEYVTAEDIHQMHINFGWDGIGYHKIIEKDGSIKNGRPEFWIGAHTKGINSISLGVCMIGRLNFSQNQYKSLKNVIFKWKVKYPEAKILGHRDAIVTEKTCPNFNVELWVKKNKLNEDF